MVCWYERGKAAVKAAATGKMSVGILQGRADHLIGQLGYRLRSPGELRHNRPRVPATRAAGSRSRHDISCINCRRLLPDTGCSLVILV